MKRPIRFSQNFLHSPTLVKNLLSKTNITDKDTVYDIGAGKGILAAALASRCHTVIAVEADHSLAIKLQENLHKYSNVLVYEGDFLELPLPKTPYKVFANIPFNLSADILHKLVDAKNPPKSSYLIVQKEFAQKLITTKDGYNSQLAVLLGVQFEVRIVKELRQDSFYPRPRVAAVLLEILQRPESLVAAKDLQLFRNFVIFAYNAFRPTLSKTISPLFNSKEFILVAKALKYPPSASPSQLHLEQWLNLFSVALKKRPLVEQLVSGYEEALAKKHAKRIKQHRTR